MLVINSNKAKDAFLLGVPEFRNLVSVSLPGTAPMYLLSDIKEASFAKYGGADGLAQEFVSRTQKAMTRFRYLQNTPKRMKKEPRVRILLFIWCITCYFFLHCFSFV